MYTSSFDPPGLRTRYLPSYAVRMRPEHGQSRAAVGLNNRAIHAEMLTAYGARLDETRFDATIGFSYLDHYRLLAGRAAELGLGLPALVAAGHAVPDLRLDETPSLRLIGEYDGPQVTFAVMDESPFVALLCLHSALVAARSQSYGAFAVILSDRADLVYGGSESSGGGSAEVAVLLRFDVAAGAPSAAAAGGGPNHRVQWRAGLRTDTELAGAADEMAAGTAETIIVSADLATRWRGPADRVKVAPTDQPATGLVDLALDEASGSAPLLMAFDIDRGQLAALTLRIPDVNR